MTNERVQVELDTRFDPKEPWFEPDTSLAAIDRDGDTGTGVHPDVDAGWDVRLEDLDQLEIDSDVDRAETVDIDVNRGWDVNLDDQDLDRPEDGLDDVDRQAA